MKLYVCTSVKPMKDEGMRSNPNYDFFLIFFFFIIIIIIIIFGKIYISFFLYLHKKQKKYRH